MRALAEQSISLVLLQTVSVTTTILFPSPSRTSQVVAAPLRRIDEASVESSSSKKKKKQKEKEKKEEEEGIARKDCPELKGNLLFGNHQSTRTSSTPQLESHSRTSDHRLTKRSNRRTYIHIYISRTTTHCASPLNSEISRRSNLRSPRREKSPSIFSIIVHALLPLLLLLLLLDSP